MSFLPIAPERIYHRRASQTQTAADAERQERNGELWGRANRGSDFPSVDAYLGPLPPGLNGIEFVTDVAPSPYSPPRMARWTHECPGVIVEGDFARIPIQVVHNRQRL